MAVDDGGHEPIDIVGLADIGRHELAGRVGRHGPPAHDDGRTGGDEGVGDAPPDAPARRR